MGKLILFSSLFDDIPDDSNSPIHALIAKVRYGSLYLKSVIFCAICSVTTRIIRVIMLEPGTVTVIEVFYCG